MKRKEVDVSEGGSINREPLQKEVLKKSPFERGGPEMKKRGEGFIFSAGERGIRDHRGGQRPVNP